MQSHLIEWQDSQRKWWCNGVYTFFLALLQIPCSGHVVLKHYAMKVYKRVASIFTYHHYRHGWTILKWILEGGDGMVWIGSNWLRIGTSGRLL
jgi:hypothetical protein